MRARAFTAMVGIVLVHLLTAIPVGAARAALPSGFVEAVLEIEVNSSAGSQTTVVLRDSKGAVWIEAADLASLRLNTPNVAPLNVDGKDYFALNALAGATLTIDEQTQMAKLTVPAHAFGSTSIALGSTAPSAIPQADFGGFLNYELSGEHDMPKSGDDISFGVATAELGFFGPHGVVTQTAFGDYSTERQRAIRLETTWIHDLPARLQSLRVGDSINSTSRWGRSVRFGGVQWGSNFAVRPDLVTAPLLSAAGEAVVPSTVDVFVNNRQVASEQVPAGPFVIDRLPAISGAGDVRLVVRDALGREQVITAPFYSSNALLQADLAQYSLEVGKIRRNYAIESNEYGALLASGTYRRGITDSLTLESHGEYLQSDALGSSIRALGVDALLSVGQFGVIGATVANGSSESSSGWLNALSFERSGRRFSFIARSQFASEGFRQVGDAQSNSLDAARRSPPPSQQHIVQTSVNMREFGSFALAYVRATYRDQPRRESGTLSYNLSVGRIGYLSLSASHVWSDPDAISAFVILTTPLTQRRSTAVSARYDKDTFFEQRELIATLQQNAPIGNGTGYRLSASTANNYSASWLRQFDNAAVEVAGAQYLDTSAVRGSVAGAATLIGGELVASRTVHDSFALVDIAGIPDISVFVDHQAAIRTDENGRALIRNLRAYESNRISVDPTQLPLDTSLQTDRIVVTPRYRSGLVVKFPVQRERSGTFRLVLPDNRPVPAGAVVTLKGEHFAVALDGLTYVTGLDHGMPARAEWNGGACEFRVTAGQSNDPLPDLGTIVCRPSVMPSQ